MSDLTTLELFTDGQKNIAAANMNGIVSKAKIQPDAIANKPSSVTMDVADQFLVLKTDNTLARSRFDTITNSTAAILPVADTTKNGMMRQVSGLTTDVVDGTNHSVDLGATVLGQTFVTNAGFTKSIIVPSFANHPDAAWTYGAKDDHFDSGTVDAKWTQTLGTNGQINIGRSHLSLWQPATSIATFTTGVSCTVPAAANFTVTLKARWHGGAFWNQNGNVTGFYIGIYSGATATSVRYRYTLSTVNPATNAVHNNMRFMVEGASNYATVFFDGLMAGDMPLYFQIIYNHSTRGVNGAVSFDGLNYYIPYGGISGAQSVFTTTPPTNFQIVAMTTAVASGSAFSYIDIDWVRFT